MQHVFLQFAAASEPAAESGGIGALGLNWQAFLFQLITFLIVFLVLRQFVFKRLTKTLEARRTTVEDSIKQAAQIETKLQKAEETAASIITEAREAADDVAATSRKEAALVMQDAQAKAEKQAEHIVKEAEARMEVEMAKTRKALKAEVAHLVALATEHIIKEKLDSAKDNALISDALHQADPVSAKGKGGANG